MKKLALILLVIASTFASCSKTDNSPPFDAAAQAATDDAAIQAYIKNNSIAAFKDPSGVYYQIITAGTGAQATSSSTITCNYSGKYLDGTSFTQGTLTPTPLANLIPGWIYGIPHCKVNGRILLLIPSALGYGHSPTNGIKGDAVLIFTIDLTGAQ
jgi:FKBP-type peptidyl-prolyl cis-trans isomerase FkpA